MAVAKDVTSGYKATGSDSLNQKCDELYLKKVGDTNEIDFEYSGNTSLSGDHAKNRGAFVVKFCSD